MWAVWIENHHSDFFIENGWIKPTTLRPMIVDDTPLTIVKDTPSWHVLELPVAILPESEEILREAKILYPGDIWTAQWHLPIQTALDASVPQAGVRHLVHWIPRSRMMFGVITRLGFVDSPCIISLSVSWCRMHRLDCPSQDACTKRPADAYASLMEA
jgi:hypothetical protein